MKLRYLFAVLVVLIGGPAAAEDQARRLTVQGEGRVEAAPDMATIMLGVTTEAKGAREAIDSNSKAMAGVLRRLAAAGIAERDLQTSSFSVYPRRSDRLSSGSGEIVGFVAQNMLSVRVRALERLGQILDEVVRDGANSFGGLSFGLQDPGPVRDAARRAAVADAQAQAALLAEAAGVTLGPLLTLDAQYGGPEPMMMEMADARMATAAVPVASGELTVTARVTLVYAIAD